MAAVAGVGWGLAVVRLSGVGWFGWFTGLLAAVAAWVALGLLCQTRDLLRASPPRDPLPPGAVWGWRLAIFWRVAAVGLLAAYYLVWALEESGVYTPPDVHDWMAFWHGELAEAALYLLLFAALASASNLFDEPRSALTPKRVSLVLQWTAAAALAAYLAWDGATILFLVHVATVGMEQSQALTLYDFGAYLNVDPNVAARQNRFALPAALAALCAPLNAALVWRLGREWTRGPRRRWLAALLLAPPLAFAAFQSIHVRTHALDTLSPPIAAAVVLPPRHYVIAAAALLLVLATAACTRVLSSASQKNKTVWALAGASSRRYGHARRDVAALLAAGLLGVIVELIIHGWDWNLGPEDFLEIPWFYLHLALLLLCVRILFARRRHPPGDEALPMISFTPGQFAAVWCALLLTIACAIDSFAWLGFVLWFAV